MGLLQCGNASDDVNALLSNETNKFTNKPKITDEKAIKTEEPAKQ